MLAKGRKEVFVVISNVAWLLPTFVAWLGEAYVWSFAAIVMMALSVLYHMTLKRLYEVLDTIAAVIFLAAGPMLLYVQEATWNEWLLTSGCFLLAMCIYIIARTRHNRRDYVRWHILWHVIGAVLCAVVYWCAFW